MSAVSQTDGSVGVFLLLSLKTEIRNAFMSEMTDEIDTYVCDEAFDFFP